jgi:hypothetical protein
MRHEVTIKGILPEIPIEDVEFAIYCGYIGNTKRDDKPLNIKYERDSNNQIIVSSEVPEAKPYLRHLSDSDDNSRVSNYVNSFPHPKRQSLKSTITKTNHEEILTKVEKDRPNALEMAAEKA